MRKFASGFFMVANVRGEGLAGVVVALCYLSTKQAPRKQVPLDRACYVAFYNYTDVSRRSTSPLISLHVFSILLFKSLSEPKKSLNISASILR